MDDVKPMDGCGIACDDDRIVIVASDLDGCGLTTDPDAPCGIRVKVRGGD